MANDLTPSLCTSPGAISILLGTIQGIYARDSMPGETAAEATYCREETLPYSEGVLAPDFQPGDDASEILTASDLLRDYHPASDLPWHVHLS